MNSQIVILFLLLQLVAGSYSLKACDERVPDSLTCDQYVDSCTDPTKIALCQRYCGICQGSHTATKPPVSIRILQSSNCVDTSGLCRFRKASCGTAKVNAACPETCGLCFKAPNTHVVVPNVKTPRKQTTLPAKKTTVKPATAKTVRPTTESTAKPTRPTTMSSTTQTSRPTTIRMQTTTVAPTTRKASCVNYIATCNMRKAQCDTSEYIRIACPKTCFNCNPPPPSYVTAKPKSEVKTVKAQPVLLQQPKSETSSNAAVKSCVDMTKFLCPMLSCMTDNSEFKKLCEQQSVFICDQ